MDEATQALVDGAPGADDAYAAALSGGSAWAAPTWTSARRRSPTPSAWPSTWTSR